MPYILVIVLLCILSLYEFLDIKTVGILVRKNTKLWFYLICAVSLWLIAALRFETGRDWQGYVQFFEIWKDSNETGGYELGFVLLNRIFGLLGADFYFLQFCISSFCALIVFRNFFKNSDFPAFTLLLYVFMFFFSTDMAQTRQHIAMAILICGNCFIKDRKLFLWILMIALAMMFHVSAIMAFPLYFTYKIRIDKKIAWVLFFVYLIVYLFGLAFVLGMLNFVVKLPFVPSRIALIGGVYLASKTYGLQTQFGSGLGFLLNMFFIAFIIFMFYINKNNKNKKNNFHFVNFFIALYFLAFGRNFDQFSRIANYYLICGNGLCAYNYLIEGKTFFKKIDFLRYFMLFIFLTFNVYTFYKTWYAENPITHASYNSDYLPYKSYILK